MKPLDSLDRAILRALQRDASLSQRALAEAVGLSQTACARRLAALQEAGVLTGSGVRLNPGKVGLGLTVFVMVRTRHHSRDWLAEDEAALQDLLSRGYQQAPVVQADGEFWTGFRPDRIKALAVA